MNNIFNIGDKVRFLNDIGGGKVSGFQKGGIILVEDDDGFEIPVREQEVVLIDAAEKKLNGSADHIERMMEPNDMPTNRIMKDITSKPADTTDITTFEERIKRLEHTVKKLQRQVEELQSAKSLRERLKDSDIKVTETMKKKVNTVDNMLEVDLHATEILDTTAGMTATDIKDYQIEVFHRTMKEHLKNKGLRIVFIHGNGDGVLRRAILKELRTNYNNCLWQDASFQQYGFGATMVTIK